MRKRRRPRPTRATFNVQELERLCDLDPAPTWPAIAAALGVSQPAVWEYCRRHGIHKARPAPRTMLATFMRHKGLTARQMGQRIGMHPNSVERMANARSPVTFATLGRMYVAFGDNYLDRTYLDMISEECE